MAWTERCRAPIAALGSLALLVTPVIGSTASASASSRAYAPTHSVTFARAREAIMKTSPKGGSPRIGRCRRSREWTTCAVYERRVLTEEDGRSYPVTLAFQEAVGERAHQLIFVTKQVAMLVPAAVVDPHS